jgi:hypothetical protein
VRRACVCETYMYTCIETVNQRSDKVKYGRRPSRDCVHARIAIHAISMDRMIYIAKECSTLLTWDVLKFGDFSVFLGVRPLCQPSIRTGGASRPFFDSSGYSPTTSGSWLRVLVATPVAVAGPLQQERVRVVGDVRSRGRGNAPYARPQKVQIWGSSYQCRRVDNGGVAEWRRAHGTCSRW